MENVMSIRITIPTMMKFANSILGAIYFDLDKDKFSDQKSNMFASNFYERSNEVQPDALLSKQKHYIYSEK